MRNTPISRERVFSLPFMASLAYVASPVPRLVCLEVVEALRPALRQRSNDNEWIALIPIEKIEDAEFLPQRRTQGPISSAHNQE